MRVTTKQELGDDSVDRAAPLTPAEPRRPLRVVVACSWFLKYSAAQAVGLRSAGAEVAVLCRDRLEEFDGSADEYRRAVDAVRRAGCDVFVLTGRISSIASLPAFRRVRRALADWGPDVVHAHENNDPRLLALAWPYPRVLTVHDPIPHPGDPQEGPLSAWVARQWVRRADLLVVHGERLAPLIGTEQEVVIVPHGTKPAAQPYEIPARPTVLLFGRLEPYKGLDVLLDAMDRVWHERSDVTLEIVGAGPEAARIPDHPGIRRSDGYLPEAKVDSMFGRATIVVLPYTAGSQSGVGSQAVGRGIPTIVSDVGALPELALRRSQVVPPGDVEALAQALLRHLDHGPALRRRVHEDALDRLSWEAVGRKSLTLYEDLLARRHEGRMGAHR